MPIGSGGGPPVFIGGLGGARPIGRLITEKPPQSGDDILANGDILTGTSSLIDGAAIGAAGAVGATLTTTGSISTSGVAIGAAGAVGGTVSSNTSLVDGAASGAAGAVGGTVTATSSISTAGAATGGASAGAITLQAATALIDGAATAGAGVDAAAAGATITTTASLISGAAVGAAAGDCHDAFQRNAFQDNAFQICAEQAVVEIPVPVQAFGGRPKPERLIRLELHGRARGKILVVTARLISGTAAADAYVAGRTLERPVSLIPGQGGVSAQTPAGDVVCMATLMAGEATGFDAIKHDNEFFLLAA